MPRLTAPDDLRALLARTRTIAMVGASPDALRPSHGIMRHLQAAGYRVIPINPTRAGETLLGETIVPRLAEAGSGIDLVNVFRRPDALGEVVADTIAAGLSAIWTQLGVRDEAAAEHAEASGLVLVMDRCISVEHRRLIG